MKPIIDINQSIYEYSKQNFKYLYKYNQKIILNFVLRFYGLPYSSNCPDKGFGIYFLIKHMNY